MRIIWIILFFDYLPNANVKDLPTWSVLLIKSITSSKLQKLPEFVLFCFVFIMSFIIRILKKEF